MNSKSISSIAVLVLTLFFPIFLFAQKMTKKEAIEYANQLNEVEILSEKGRDLLIQHINEEKLVRGKRQDMSDGSIRMVDDLSNAQILGFLAKAFGSDFYYRSGMIEQQAIAAEIDRSNETDFEKIQEQIDRKVQAAFPNFKGPKIEEKIECEENAIIPNDEGFTIYPFGIGALGVGEYGFIHEKCSVWGKTFLTTFSKLKEIGLINQKIHDEIIKMVKEEEVLIEMYAMSHAASRTIFYEDYEEEKAKEHEFIKNLHKHNLISDENLKILLEPEKEKHLKSKYELVKYCENTKVFDVRDYSVDASQGYQEIFEEIKTLLPDTDIENFKAELITEEDWGGDMLEQNLSISFDANGNTYSCQSFYDFKKINPETNEVIEEDTILQISNDFHKGINKYLADKNADYRLYFVNKSEPGQAYGRDEFAVILMTEKQVAAWGSYEPYLFSRENHSNEFNTKNIQKFIATCDSLGLFSHITQEEIDEGYKCIEDLQDTDYQSVLYCFPKIIVAFDWETGNLENPYEELTLAFGEASRGAFTPTNIVDTFEKSWEMETTSYAFDFKGKTYHKELAVETDWLDYNFMELMEKAMDEHGVDGSFHDCCGSGQFSGYIFLSNVQHKYLKENHPALFSDY